MNAYGMMVNGSDIKPVVYHLSNQAIKDGFKYELIYQGVDEHVVRIAYREFTESLARPAFYQDLTYTLGDSGEADVRFREVALHIHGADNGKIDYTVQSGF